MRHRPRVITISKRSVPTATRVGQPMTYISEGILMKPPPTPRKPARKPVNAETIRITQTDMVNPETFRCIHRRNVQLLHLQRKARGAGVGDGFR